MEFERNLDAKRDKNAMFIKIMGVNTMLLGVLLIGIGVWMSTYNDDCQKFYTPWMIVIGIVIFLISLIGFLGALNYNLLLLWIYLVFMGFSFILLLVFTATGLIVTSNDHVDGLRFKEYQLQDSGSWVKKMVNNNHTWGKLKSCFVQPRDCGHLPKVYKTLQQYNSADLSVIEAGCCRPPSECGYPAINASYYDLSFGPISSKNDCKLYNNSEAIKCFGCDACKAGVLQHIKKVWRMSLIDSGSFLVALIIVINCGCVLRKRGERIRQQRAAIYPVGVLNQLALDGHV